MGTAEKRKHPRYTFKEEYSNRGRFTSLSWIQRRRTLQTQIYDLSEGGISLIVPAYLAPKKGEVLAVEFTVPGSEQVACKGTVVNVLEANWINPDDRTSTSKFVKVGIQFVELPQKYKLAISRHLDKILSQSEFQGQMKDIGIQVRATFKAVSYHYYLVLALLLAFLIMFLFVDKMQDVSSSKWWLEGAKSYFESMKSDRVKDLEKQFK